ncbi:breast cancer type 1 susceptibility protein homolog [Cydia pomonella]|uniref:breast cancer type 1 susceptibility protein homolog n=1 Tax=Cydia pomonella TaxID=82600 RepID=UPI002ADE5919|nr:breast cancer type 1 susceptibility protein homolog [Cydia pomonella]
MEKVLKKFNPENAAKELTRVVENVTCLECCKFYIVPETAACGHTLCHGCWIGRQTCPVCALPLKKRALTQNAVIKRYTECVQKATALFEKQFNIKMEEFAVDSPVQAINKIVEKDPSKTVNAWLCDSQNHFSAPVSSQLSTQGEDPTIEVKTCEIQVHTESKKVQSPTKVIHAPPPPQDDWDKIEVVSDTEEFLKNKENFGPHIEPFHLDDDEYTTDHPRRSSRKREHKNESKPSETSGDKHSSSNISLDTTDKLNKIKQNWSNVKKMKKEFSKLHKKNKNKLNVSIEMCKKTKSAISKPAPSVEPESQKVIIIDDCTPTHKSTPKIAEKEKSPVSDKITINTGNKHDTEDLSNKSSGKASPKDRLRCQAMDTNENNDNMSKRDHRTNSSSILNNFKSYDVNQREPIETEVNLMSRSNIPFLKKSALHTDKPSEDSNPKSTEIAKENTIQTVNHAVNDNIETDSDDIQITIKIGSTLTNIFIKKKKNDVKVKLNTDQEAQTLQCMEKTTSCKSSSSVSKTLDVQNIEINIGGEGVVSAVTQQTKCIEPRVDQPPTATSVKANLNKTASTKKDTASAETIPIEISASLEKELTKIMECDDDDDKKNNAQKKKTQEPQEKNEDVHKVSSTYTPNKEEISKELELDEDMFASGSVKEKNVQLLKATKPAPSEILMPTYRQKKLTQTQRQANKRNRENDDEMTSNKKLKVTSEDYEDSIDDIHNKDNKDESSINYDSVMNQVFANIDADIGKTSKSQSIIENPDKTLADKEAETQAITQHSQFLKTQKTQRKVLGLSRLGNATQNIQSNLPPKDSESLFALSNVDSQILTDKGHNQRHGPETQAHIENLLTPGICQDLADTHRQEAGHNRQEAGHNRQEAGHNRQEAGQNRQEAGHNRQEADHIRQEAGHIRQEAGHNRQKADHNRQKADHNRQDLADTHRQEAGHNRQEAYHNRQEAGHNRQEAGHNRQEAGHNRQEDGHTSQHVIPATPQDHDSDASVCEETPQKASSFTRKPNAASGAQPKQTQSQLNPKEAQLIKEIINISDTDKDKTVIAKPKLTLATPTINQFCNSIQHYSTPVARKSLNFDTAESTNSPSSTRRNEFSKPRTPNVKFCVAASGLKPAEVKDVESLCAQRGWTFVKEFTKDLTHLVVKVDEEGRSQRTVKYMCALAAGRWIVRYEWVDACLRRGHAAEEPFEALDWTGEPGPRRARGATRKLFHGFTFFCMPPFSVLSEPVLKVMLESAGGRVVPSVRDVHVQGEDVRLLLAEPEHTQENRFTYLALEQNIVPVNYEWALNCLGSYSVTSILELMLCPSSLLPAVTSKWPQALITQEFDTVIESD